jgi:tRNA A-37 threonylcarbamoyl transferase component Bud32
VEPKNLKALFLEKIVRVRPWIVFRLAAVTVLLTPFFVVAFLLSFRRIAHWRRTATCRNFMLKHARWFSGVDVSSLVVESKSGGVSNSNEIWRCRKRGGESVDYFVKVFLPVGSFWARHLSWLSPFPSIRKSSVDDRLKADRRSRVTLPEHDVPVPRLVMYDSEDKVMVTECLEGETVDDGLKRIAARGTVTPHEIGMIRQCGRELAKIHSAGFSLIDTQPVNCLWVPAEAKVYFTDLEYCTREDKRSWDAGFFLAFLLLRLSAPLRVLARTAFLDGYAERRAPDLRGIEETARKLQDYVPLLEIILDAREFTPEKFVEELAR